MKFFLDNNLSRKLADGLKAFGEEVEHLRESFSEDAPDTAWLPYVGRNNMVLLTRDMRIRYHPVEIKSLKRHNVGAFFVTGKNLNRCRIIQLVVRKWPDMKKIAENKNPPFAYKVPWRGQIKNIPLD